MNTSEKIAALEALLVRVQRRAQDPRPARAPQSVVIEAAPATASVEPSPEPPAAVTTPPATAAPAPVIEPAVEAVVPAPTAAPVSAKGVAASYVAKGGMSEELPDFDLEDEDEDEAIEDEIIVEETAVQAAVVEQSADEAQEEAEELAIPLRPSTQMRAVVPPTPIELPRGGDDLVLESTPLASALPAATEEAIALQARKIPPSSVPAMPAVASSLDDLELDVAPSAPEPPAAHEIKPPAQSQAIAAPIPEPLPDAPIPLVQPARAPEQPAPATAPAPVVLEAAPVAPPAAEAKAPAPPVAQPVAHEARALPEADVVAIDHDLPREPASFATLVRRALALRVK